MSPRRGALRTGTRTPNICAASSVSARRAWGFRTNSRAYLPAVKTAIGAETAEIKAEAENRYGRVTIEADISENKRALYVNGTKLTKSADLMGHINSVFFSPGELRLIQDGPDERRRFINMSVSQTSPAYYTALLRYMRILDQRNALLKNPDYGTVAATLPVWDEQLCRYAAAIAVKRREFLARLVAYAADTHAYLTDGKETLSLTPDQTYTGDEEEIAERLKKRLKNSYEKDRRLGYTTVGPHRDDISFVISGKEARGYASQGQTRTAALALKLAEVEIFKEVAGEYRSEERRVRKECRSRWSPYH